MKKESKAKSVVIAVIAIILALCAVGAVVGVGSNGFENWDPSSWFKPDDTEDPITSDDDKPKVNTYDDITTVINGLSLNMTDDGVHASSQTVANSNGGTDTWHYYTFSLDDKGLYTGSTEYNHDYNLYASFNDNDYVAFKSVSSDNAQELLAYNSAIWGEKCIYHNSYAVSGTVCHFYVYSCRIDDVCAYLNGDTSVCHPKDNVLTIGISTVDYELESFEVDYFGLSDYDDIATMLKGIDSADYSMQTICNSFSDGDVYFGYIVIDDRGLYTGPIKVCDDFDIDVSVSDREPVSLVLSSNKTGMFVDSAIIRGMYQASSDDELFDLFIFPGRITDLSALMADSTGQTGIDFVDHVLSVVFMWANNESRDFTITDVEYTGA